jgi:hypothetical protein
VKLCCDSKLYKYFRIQTLIDIATSLRDIMDFCRDLDGSDLSVYGDFL